MAIEHPDKIGIGTWDKDSLGSALNDVDRAGFNWYYNWAVQALWDVDAAPENANFVAMVRDRLDANSASLSLLPSSGATTLLGFNEPDNVNQANMSVAKAIELWPRLEATGLRLGSPAPSQEQALGENSWLGRFMQQAEEAGRRVDFIQLHYYSDDKDVGAFKEWLEAAHEQYGRPIWVTEWGLADWDDPNRFSAHEQAVFAKAGSEMMDDLSFVKKQAWFAAYDGGGGWDINSGLFDENGKLTEVGRVFMKLTDPPEPLGDPRIVSGMEPGRSAVHTDAIEAAMAKEEAADRLASPLNHGGADDDTFDFVALNEAMPGPDQERFHEGDEWLESDFDAQGGAEGSPSVERPAEWTAAGLDSNGRGHTDFPSAPDNAGEAMGELHLPIRGITDSGLLT